MVGRRRRYPATQASQGRISEVAVNANNRLGGRRCPFRVFAVGARLFPICGKGRRSGRPFGPASDFSFFPILALLPSHPQPANEFTVSVFPHLVLAHSYHCPSFNIPPQLTRVGAARYQNSRAARRLTGGRARSRAPASKGASEHNNRDTKILLQGLSC